MVTNEGRFWCNGVDFLGMERLDEATLAPSREDRRFAVSRPLISVTWIPWNRYYLERNRYYLADIIGTDGIGSTTK